jgi:hypothetical protein
MKIRLVWLLCSTAIASVTLLTPLRPDSISPESGKVKLLRVPNSGIQPQAVMDEKAVLHLIYFAGEPSGGDIFYLRREPGKEFSTPLRVNNQSFSAIATGTIRGAQLALGMNRRVHVAWNGSGSSEPKGPNNSAPMLYTRLNDAGTAFEVQRNVMQISGGLDGGGSLAADKTGNIYVAWHGSGHSKDAQKSHNESDRRVWLARSTDDGKTFAREETAFNGETGACGCCGMRAFVDPRGDLYLLYRTATKMINRGMYLLISPDRGRSFRGLALDQWQLTTCPMSSATMTINSSRHPMAAWENNGQVYFAALSSSMEKAPLPTPAPGETGRRKHPAIATNAVGETILVWTEGTGWKKGGALSWQVFDRNGIPTEEKGQVDGVPVWSFGTVVADQDGTFLIVY